MVVNTEIRKCVVFIGYMMANDSFELAGSAFYIGRRVGTTDKYISYLVTARHVIDKIRNLGIDQITLRLNTEDGFTKLIHIPISNWLFHLTTDVAVLLNPPSLKTFDHRILPISNFLNQKYIEKNGMGTGDEVFITGLFRHHHGKSRNIPIVRIGNICAMDEEKVVTEDFGPISAYLIECRSIGGLSGSPVFVNLGPIRHINGSLKYSDSQTICFLGLIHGHFDVSTSSLDQVPDKQAKDSVNTGIATVVPYYEVLKTLEHPQIIALEELINKIR